MFEAPLLFEKRNLISDATKVKLLVRKKINPYSLNFCYIVIKIRNLQKLKKSKIQWLIGVFFFSDQ